MVSNSLKFLVVAFVALLQCCLPLIHGHAHAHEMPGPHHVHIHGDGLGMAGSAAMPEIKAPGDYSPAIGVSEEFKRDFFLLPVPGIIAILFLAAAGQSRRALQPRDAHGCVATPLHGRPPATAPPARAV